MEITTKCIRIARLNDVYALLIQGFNRLVDWATLLVIISVAEPAMWTLLLITVYYFWTTEAHARTVICAQIHEPRFGGFAQDRTMQAYRWPQWQKSDDTEKKLEGLSMYLANKRPYIPSASVVQLPTRIGTIFTEHLQNNQPISPDELPISRKQRHCTTITYRHYL